MRGKNLVKFLRALELFSKPAGITINELGEQLGIDRRSVYRLINVVEELGFPLRNDEVDFEKEKRWKLMESYTKKLPNMRVPDINLTLPEIISLYLYKGEATLFKGTEIEKHANLAYGKLGFFIPEKAFSQLSKIKALFVSPSKFAKDYSGKEDIIDQLTEAILKNETCYVKYHSFYDDKIKNFKIDPLHFFESNAGLYLLVNTTSFGDIRTLALERIQEISKTGDFFEYPKDFDPEELLESAFDIVYEDPIDVKIWFSSGQAPYIRERKWSKTQKIEDQEDGSIILSMSTSGWWDVKKWILSYGAEAMVLEPEELKKEIIDEIEVAKENYK
jgi:predicted DNA-binding transcriptional regulator YafY